MLQIMWNIAYANYRMWERLRGKGGAIYCEDFEDFVCFMSKIKYQVFIYDWHLIAKTWHLAYKILYISHICNINV